jgi:hypothetical protein
MITTQLALDKKAHPLMMHLSILSKYDISEEPSISYESSTQTSNINSRSCTWACIKGSSPKHWPHKPDDDQQKGDSDYNLFCLTDIFVALSFFERPVEIFFVLQVFPCQYYFN